jgi:hypothetical protein
MRYLVGTTEMVQRLAQHGIEAEVSRIVPDGYVWLADNNAPAIALREPSPWPEQHQSPSNRHERRKQRAQRRATE